MTLAGLIRMQALPQQSAAENRRGFDVDSTLSGGGDNPMQRLDRLFVDEGMRFSPLQGRRTQRTSDVQKR